MLLVTGDEHGTDYVQITPCSGTVALVESATLHEPFAFSDVGGRVWGGCCWCEWRRGRRFVRHDGRDNVILIVSGINPLRLVRHLTVCDGLIVPVCLSCLDETT